MNLAAIVKIYISLLATVLLASVSNIRAQPTGKLHRIGTLENTSPAGRAHLWDAFRGGLRDLSYVEGKNILLEQRWSEGKSDRLPALVDELVRLKVDVIVTAATGAALAAKKATSTIPIVMASQSDPVGTGLVASLARPGGNVTGLSSMNVELGGKRLELLKESFPKISRVAFLQGIQGASLQVKEIDAAARALGVQLQIVDIRPEDFESAFQTMAKQRADALITESSPFLFGERKRLVEIAAKSRLPAMYPESEFVDAGGLMSYGNLQADMFRRAATLVDKILKGAKPADLPVEQPMKFEFVVNLRAAKQQGLTIPPEVLFSANKVIK